MADKTPQQEFEEELEAFERSKAARLRRIDEVSTDLARGGTPDEKSPI